MPVGDEKHLDSKLSDCKNVGEMLEAFSDHYQLWNWQPSPTVKIVLITALKNAVKQMHQMRR